MSSKKTQKTYNYDNFKPGEYDFADFDGLKVGEAFLDAEVFDLDGTPLRLSNLLDQPLVLEMGSMTCPMYAQSTPPMQTYVKTFPLLNFAVLYVREAHPGEKIRAHKSVPEKIEAAKRVESSHGEHRRVLVDDVDGTAHKAYGSMPNSIYIIGKDGQIIFRSIWNNTNEIRDVLEAVSKGENVDAEDMHPIPPFGANGIRTLALGGWVAFRDFIVGLPKLMIMHKKAGNL